MWPKGPSKRTLAFSHIVKDLDSLVGSRFTRLAATEGTLLVQFWPAVRRVRLAQPTRPLAERARLPAIAKHRRRATFWRVLRGSTSWLAAGANRRSLVRLFLWSLRACHANNADSVGNVNTMLQRPMPQSSVVLFSFLSLRRFRIAIRSTSLFNSSAKRLSDSDSRNGLSACFDGLPIPTTQAT